MSAICITFAESVENHFGNQQIGERCSTGWSASKLRSLHNKFKNKSEIVNLNELLVGTEFEGLGDDACVLIIRKCIDEIFHIDSNDCYEHLKTLNWDKKYFDQRRQRVLNKHARWNVCFSEFAQDADYENGKGTVYTFNESKLSGVKRKVESLMSTRSSVVEKLNAEGNYYYDIKKCGIGMHGDTERRKVFGVSLGSSRKLVFQWYHNAKSITNKVTIDLNHGDCYIMSDKAVGYDWRKRSKITLRHGAGIENSKYI